MNHRLSGPRSARALLGLCSGRRGSAGVGGGRVGLAGCAGRGARGTGSSLSRLGSAVRTVGWLAGALQGHCRSGLLGWAGLTRTSTRPSIVRPPQEKSHRGAHPSPSTRGRLGPRSHGDDFPTPDTVTSLYFFPFPSFSYKQPSISAVWRGIVGGARGRGHPARQTPLLGVI